MQNHSVAIVRPASGEVVFNSSVLTTEAEAIDSEAGTGHLRTAAVRTSEWEVYQESAASGCAEHQSSAKGPIEQLHLTGGGTAVDEFYSDYLWYGPLNYRTAARTLFLRPYLAHFCSFFRRFFAVLSVLTPGFQKVALEDRGPVP